MAFKFNKTPLEGLLHIESDKHFDNRGFSIELYEESIFKDRGIEPLIKTYFSMSKKNVLRGIHYQINPKAQGKLVCVASGKIFDVAVDLRKGSPTYLRWVGVELDETKNNLLYIPKGFAHAYCVLEENTKVIYGINSEYSKEHERGIIWSDPQINIDWPIRNPILSEKDSKSPLFKDAENNYVYLEP